MRLLKPLLILFFAGIVTLAQAQDIHYSQYYLSPNTLNPALTGAFEGSFRVGGIYRDQWGSVIDNQFRTPSIYIDAPLFPVEKRYWIGAGISVLSDQAGSVGYRNSNFGLSAAAHVFADKARKTVVSLGAQFNFHQQRFDASLIQTENQWMAGTGFGSVGMANEGAFKDEGSYMAINAGLAARTSFGTDDKVRLNLGLGMFQINEPLYGLKETSSAKLDARLTGFANADIDLNTKLILSPGLMYQSIAGAQEVMSVLQIGYRLQRDLIVRAGQGYRFGDATNTLLGIQFKRLTVGVSYDFNISDLTTVSSGQGGFEVGVSYIGNLTTTPTVKPVIFCPGF